MNEFTNPLSLQARTKDGSYLFHLAEFRDLDKSVAVAKKWASKPKHQQKGYFAQVSDHGKVVFDSRT